MGKKFAGERAWGDESCKDECMNEGDEMARELWRRALALTGSRALAEWGAGRALGLCENPGRVSRHRRDRLVTQGAREAARRCGVREGMVGVVGELKLEGEAGQLWVASRGLPRLQMEAWTLRVVEGMEETRAARALDCSRGAMGNALAEAERALLPLVGDRYTEAVAQVREELAGSDPSASLELIAAQVHRARKRRRLISAAQMSAFVVCAGVLAWVGWDLLRSDRGRDEPAADSGAEYSAPMPKPEVGGEKR